MPGPLHALPQCFLIWESHCEWPEVEPVLATCAVSPDDRSLSQRGEVGRTMTSGSTADPRTKVRRDNSMLVKREWAEDAYGHVSQDPRAMVKTKLFEPQPPAMQAHVPCQSVYGRATWIGDQRSRYSNPPPDGRGG